MSNTVFCIGEALIDFFCAEVEQNLVEGTHFVKQAGGAPANVAAAIAKLGGSAAFCGKVGADAFGQFLIEALQQRGVDTSMLVQDETAHTTLAFVSRQSDGERDFIFNRGADRLLQIQDVQASSLGKMKIGHFGSATALLAEPFETTYMQCMHTLHAQGTFVSFDPNFRSDLWKGDVERFIRAARTCMQLADFVKLSEAELQLLTNMTDCEQAVASLHEKGVRAIAVTLDARGTYISVAGESAHVPSIDVKPLDTTGAGDAFVGAMLQQLAEQEQLKTLTLAHYTTMVRFANIVGALVCEKVGAIDALPAREDVARYFD